jgi:hypothetical protein
MRSKNFSTISMILATVILIISCSKSTPPEKKGLLPTTEVSSQTPYYIIDTINGLAINNQKQPIPLSTDKNLIVSGWAVDGEAKDAAGGVVIAIDEKLYPSTYGGARPDVADACKTPSYKNSGFKSEIPVSEIGKGLHTLSIKVLTRDGKAYYSAKGKVLFEIK